MVSKSGFHSRERRFARKLYPLAPVREFKQLDLPFRPVENAQFHLGESVLFAPFVPPLRVDPTASSMAR